MKSLSETILGRALGLLANAVTRYRWLFLWPQVFFCGLCVIYTVQHLKFDPSQDNLVGPGQIYHSNFLSFKAEFPAAQDDLLVVVESDDPEKNRQFVERLGRRVEQETNRLFTGLLYRNDFKMLGRKALLFVPEDDLKELKKRLADYMPFIQKFTQSSNLVSLFEMINTQIYHSKQESNPENNALISAIPVLRGIVDQATASLDRPGTPPSPGLAALFGAGDEQIYITEATNRIYLLTVQPQSEDKNDVAVERLRFLMEQTRKEIPGVNAGLTGGPVLDHDQMEQSQKDMTFASILSLVVCALIFIYGYQETGRPLKATFCLLIGLGYTMAFTTATIGHLNILTITFMPMLIGLAIDFGVHLITRYEEELRLGRTEAAAVRTAMVFTGQGIFTGALTTAVAFLAMALTHFRGIQEMGVICGGGMLVCLIPMLTMLPVMLFRGRQNLMDIEQASKPDLRSRIESVWLRRPNTTVAVVLVLTALAATRLHKVYFDYDLLNLQANGLPAVEFVKKQIAASARSDLFGVVIASNAEEAIRLEHILTNLPTVTNVESMASRVVGDQTGQLKLIREIKQEIAPLHFAQTDLRPVELSKLSATLYSTEGYMGAASDAAEKDDPAVAKQLIDLRWAINPLIRKMLADPDTSSRKLAWFQQALFDDIHSTFENLQDQDDTSPLRVQDLPEALKKRFIGRHGKFLLQVYPKKDVWKRQNQEEFVKQLQAAVPNATGEPVQLYYYVELLKDSYILAGYYSLAAIVFMVLIHFRTLSSVILALLPVAIGSVWLGGIMGWAGIPFNPANIMTVPLIIGIGVTNGIHILNRFAEEKNPSILGKSTGKAVFVSGLTTLSGFGSLMVGQHRGIRTLGEIMSVGITTCMIAALTFLPALLRLLYRHGAPAKKQPSGDNARSTLGREEPR